MRNGVSIGRRLIGAGEPAFIIAEIGINHNGDLDIAKRTGRFSRGLRKRRSEVSEAHGRRCF